MDKIQLWSLLYDFFPCNSCNLVSSDNLMSHFNKWIFTYLNIYLGFFPFRLQLFFLLLILDELKSYEPSRKIEKFNSFKFLHLSVHFFKKKQKQRNIYPCQYADGEHLVAATNLRRTIAVTSYISYGFIRTQESFWLIKTCYCKKIPL